MKKTVSVLLCAAILLFSGCKSFSSDTPESPVLFPAQTLNAQITSESFSCSARYSILDDSSQKIEITSPDEAQGICIIHKKGETKIYIDSLGSEGSSLYTCNSSFLSDFLAYVERIMQCSPSPSEDGSVLRFSDPDSGILKTTAEGILRSFESQHNNLAIEFA